MDRLPLDVITDILLLLDTDDWFTCVQVCRSWRTLTPLALSSSFHSFQVPIADGQRYINNLHLFPSVEKLLVADQNISLDVIPPGQLHSLVFRSVYFRSVEELSTACGQNTSNLACLDINAVSHEIEHCLAAILTVFTGLKILLIRMCLDEFIVDIPPGRNPINQLPVYNQLHTLVITKSNIASWGFIFGLCRNLEILFVHSYSSDKAWNVPFPVIRQLCPRLAIFAFRGFLACNDPIINICKRTPASSPRLQTPFEVVALDREFDHQFVTDVLACVVTLDLVILPPGIRIETTRLKSFRCQSCYIAKDLIYMIKHCPNLEELGVKFCGNLSGEEGMETALDLIDAVKNLKHLTKVYLPSRFRVDWTAALLEPFAHTLEFLSFAPDLPINRGGLSQCDMFGFMRTFERLKLLEIRPSGLWTEVPMTALPLLPSARILRLDQGVEVEADSMPYFDNFEEIQLRNWPSYQYRMLKDMLNASTRIRKVTLVYEAWSYNIPSGWFDDLTTGNMEINIGIDM
ncbi:hypothetical protein BX666DRAFT_1492015 [Dichotomocladium elegans]|nr:hypothetical protein BX666DRAFT_1492015 [Dichotomocladium elegans]